MSSKSVLGIMLALVLAMTLTTHVRQVSAQGGPNGPRMDNLLIKMYPGAGGGTPAAYVSHPTANTDPDSIATGDAYTYDLDDSTYALFDNNIDSKNYGFDAQLFSWTHLPGGYFTQVDIEINYGGQNVTGGNDKYRIEYRVEPSTSKVSLQDWTVLAPTNGTRVWPAVGEPNDGKWDAADIRNLHVRFLTDRIGQADNRKFWVFEIWVTIRLVPPPPISGVDKLLTALEACDIDIAEWPLTKYWSDKWKASPYNTQITQVPYTGLDIFSFDINNQRWPTGVTYLRDYDPATDSYKNYFDETDERHQRAWCFRVALARLTNKPAWSTEILKGFGKSIDSFVPDPAGGGWIWPGFRQYPTLTYDMPFGIEDEPYHHDYSVARAEEILDKAGFTRTWYGDPDGAGPLGTGWWRIDPHKTPPYNVLDLIVNVVRADDPLRLEYGRGLNTSLINVGIPTYHFELGKIAAFDKVMVYYDYHIYTGEKCDWKIDLLYDLFHSSSYWGGDEYTYYDEEGWSLNYPGFCNTEYDAVAELVKYPATFGDAMYGAWESQKVFAKYVGAIPLWSTKGFKAFKTGWDGVINEEGVGIDNKWTFLNMFNPAPTLPGTIRDGLPDHLEDPNVITSTCRWDRKFLNFIYESLLGHDPFNLAQDYGWLAKPRGPGVDGVLGTVDDAFFTRLPDWDTGKMAIVFTLRDDAVWHDGVTPVTPDDVKFSMEFTRDAGPGVAWNFPSAKNIQFVETQADDPTLEPNDIKVYFGVTSYWAAHWAGLLPIISKNIWMAANAKWGWGYPAWGSPTRYKAAYVESVTPGGSITVNTRDKKPGVPCEFEVSNLVCFKDTVSTCRDGKWHIDAKTWNAATGKWDFTLSLVDGAGELPEIGDTMVDAAVCDWDSSSIRQYDAYATWDLWVSDGNDNGIADMIEDGTGPWIFQSVDPMLYISASFTANRNYYKTQGDSVKPWGLDEIYDYLIDAFHRVGDINYDKTITEAGDGVRLMRALGTNRWGYPWDETGTLWDYYNPHADLDSDGYVGPYDLYYYGKHYMYVGWPPHGL